MFIHHKPTPRNLVAVSKVPFTSAKSKSGILFCLEKSTASVLRGLTLSIFELKTLVDKSTMTSMNFPDDIRTMSSAYATVF